MALSSGKPLIFMLKAGFLPAAPSTRPLPADQVMPSHQVALVCA